MIFVQFPDRPQRRIPFYLAAEEWVARTLPAGEYFFTWQTPPTVICGRNQLIDYEVDLEYCKRNHIDVVRRRSGGGCVYSGPGNFMLSYISAVGDTDTDFNRFTNGIVSALASVGIEANVSGRNDIEIAGKKISGCAYYRCNNRSIVHSTMLHSLGDDRIYHAITPHRSKLVTHSVRSVEARVGCLSDYGLSLDIPALRRLFAEKLCSEVIIPEAKDIAKIEKIEQRYYDPAFLRLDLDLSGSAHRQIYLPGIGSLSIDLTTDSHGHISDVHMFGDYFHRSEPHILNELLLERLQDKPTDRQAIENALANFDPEEHIPGLKLQQLIELIVQN